MLLQYLPDFIEGQGIAQGEALSLLDNNINRCFKNLKQLFLSYLKPYYSQNDSLGLKN